MRQLAAARQSPGCGQCNPPVRLMLSGLARPQIVAARLLPAFKPLSSPSPARPPYLRVPSLFAPTHHLLVVVPFAPPLQQSSRSSHSLHLKSTFLRRIPYSLTEHRLSPSDQPKVKKYQSPRDPDKPSKCSSATSLRGRPFLWLPVLSPSPVPTSLPI